MDDDIAIAIPTERSAMTGRPTGMTTRTTTRRRDVQGQVYLLHFEVPYRHAQHYLGWTEDLPTRLKDHGGTDAAPASSKSSPPPASGSRWPGPGRAPEPSSADSRTGAATPGSARSAKRANSARPTTVAGKASGQATVSPLGGQRADAARCPTR